MANLVSVAASIAELYPMEKNRVLNHSISHSPSLFDASRTQAFSLEEVLSSIDLPTIMSNATDTFPKLDGDSYSENIFLSCVICDCFVSLDKCLKIYVTVVLIISPLVSVIKLWHIYMYNPCHPLIIHVRLTPETVSISFNFYRMQQIHNCNRSSILDLLTIIVNAIDTCPKPDSDSYTENLF